MKHNPSSSVVGTFCSGGRLAHIRWNWESEGLTNAELWWGTSRPGPVRRLLFGRQRLHLQQPIRWFPSVLRCRIAQQQNPSTEYRSWASSLFNRLKMRSLLPNRSSSLSTGPAGPSIARASLPAISRIDLAS